MSQEDELNFPAPQLLIRRFSKVGCRDSSENSRSGTASGRQEEGFTTTLNRRITQVARSSVKLTTSAVWMPRGFVRLNIGSQLREPLSVDIAKRFFFNLGVQEPCGRGETGIG